MSVPSSNWKNSICLMCHVWWDSYYKWRYETYWKGYQKRSPSSSESWSSSIPLLMLLLTFCVCIAFSSSSSNIICLIAGSVYVMMSHQINVNYNLTDIEIRNFFKCTKLYHWLSFKTYSYLKEMKEQINFDVRESCPKSNVKHYISLSNTSDKIYIET